MDLPPFTCKPSAIEVKKPLVLYDEGRVAPLDLL
jgi:hypothetical protein